MPNHLFDALSPGWPAATPAMVAGAATWSHGDLVADSGRWANALATLGVMPGDRVVACVEKSAENLVLYLAALRAGAVYVPLNPAYTPAELAFFIGDAEPVLIVCDPGAREAVIAVAGGARVETLDAMGRGSLATHAADASDTFQTAARGAADLAAICYTSGTTGRSKGAMLSHGALLANGRTLKDLWRFTADDVLIHALPTYHVHGLFVAAHVLWMAGGSMIVQPRFDAGAVIAAMPRATCLMGVPTFYIRLLAHPGLGRQAAGGMRLFISGSAPLLAETHRAFAERTGQAILERYGLTETGMNTSNPYEGERLAGTVGPPLPDVNLRIASADGAPAPPGAVGGVEVKGPNLFSGYWRDPKKTREAFRADGWFITGDLGVIDGRGYLSIVGRARDLIITGGLNVYPKEVEVRIDALPGVIESAVIGLPHADLGEAVTAVVVAEAGIDEAELARALRADLAGFKRPKRFILVDELPRNAMGKVKKAALRERYAGLYAGRLNGGGETST